MSRKLKDGIQVSVYAGGRRRDTDPSLKKQKCEESKGGERERRFQDTRLVGRCEKLRDAAFIRKVNGLRSPLLADTKQGAS